MDEFSEASAPRREREWKRKGNEENMHKLKSTGKL
jgi:hypothetical protein